MNSSVVQKISITAGLALLAASVLLLLPITDSFVTITKNFLLFFFAIIFLGLFIWRSFAVKTTEFILSPLTVPLFIFGISMLASIFFTSPYPHENLLGFGGVYLATTIIALLGGTLFSKDNVKTVISTLGIVAAVLSVSSAVQMTGYGPANILNAVFSLNQQLPTDLVFNLTGSSFIALQVGVIALAAMIGHIIVTKTFPKLYAVVIPLVVIGVAIHGWSMLPGKPAAVVLPQAGASWSIALDAIRSPRAALIGSGPALYTNIYNQFKPATLNTTTIWNAQFGQASNVPLTLLATNGFLGLIAWLIIALAIFRQLKTASVESKPIVIALAISFVMHLFLPANVVLLTIEAILFASLIAAEKYRFPHISFSPLSVKVTRKQKTELHEVPLEAQRSQWPALIGAVIGGLGVLALFYVTGRAYAAHIMLNNAAKASASNDGVAVYEYQQRAVQLNPYLDYIRREYAITNILIAATLSNKTDATEAEREQVTQLIQQAIREARSATLLDPSDTQNWLVLAQIYQNMIGVTDEAEQWAIQSYVQAIQVNPTDPTLRISLGGIFLNNKEFAQAAELFAQAAQLKIDYPNAHYNLAIALQNLQQYEDAKAAYQRVLSLVEPNTDNYTTVTKELEALQKLIDENAEATKSGTPNTTGTSIINQNIEGEDSVINQPSTGDLDLSSSPAPEATVNPTPAASPIN